MKTINWNGETFYGSVPINQNTFFEVHMCGHTPPNPDYEMFRYDNIVHVFEYVVSGKGLSRPRNRARPLRRETSTC